MASESGADVHHSVPRCLLRLVDAVARDFAEWSEFDAEAERLSIKVPSASSDEMVVKVYPLGHETTYLCACLERRRARNPYESEDRVCAVFDCPHYEHL